MGSYIKVGFFESDAELIYQDEVHGSLLQQVDKALDLIYFKYLKAKISYRGIQRIERYPFPEAALREALLNAVVHKDYSSGIPIQVSVYDDQLYISNTGRLPEMWTLENLMSKHTSQPFNPTIAHAFYLSGFIESWGRGIEKIYDACREDGIYDPDYTVHPRDIMIRFTAPEERVIYSRPKKVTERVTERVTEPERQILTILVEEPTCTYQAIADRLSVSRKTISSRIGSLKKKGMIKRVGSDTKGHWEIID